MGTALQFMSESGSWLAVTKADSSTASSPCLMARHVDGHEMLHAGFCKPC